MSAKPRWFQTAAIDYPNSLPHIGTAYEKLGADVQARYRRMQGYDVIYLMGNDENTLKVSEAAEKLGQPVADYCNSIAAQFREIWDLLDIQCDVFIQTSHDRHKKCVNKFIQKVYDNGYIYKGAYSGWFCTGCEEYKSNKIHEEHQGLCPNHQRPLIQREEACWLFKLSAFQERLLDLLKNNVDFVQPESRRNEMIGFIESEGLQDLNITRAGAEWGIPFPIDPTFTIYVWFDALLTYITGIGYGDDEAQFNQFWPADVHFIGKDITRFHTHIWPAMLWAAGLELPRKVFSHGFVTVDGTKMGKTMGNVKNPKDIVGLSATDYYRHYFMRECAFASDGDYSGQRFEEVCNTDLANNLGNLLSRVATIPLKNYGGELPGTAGVLPKEVVPGLDLPAFVQGVQQSIEDCDYHVALRKIFQDFLTPTNQYLEANAPWKLVKTDLEAAKWIIYNAAQTLRIASIMLKPFIPGSAKTIYESFNFGQPWDEVSFADAKEYRPTPENLRVVAPTVDGKLKILFPKIDNKKA